MSETGKKLYKVKTRDGVELAFLPCPGNTPLLAWDESNISCKLIFSKINGGEESWHFEKDQDATYFYLGRLLTIMPGECEKLVEKGEPEDVTEENVKFKDYHSGRFYLTSANVSLCTAAQAAGFPLDKYSNPLVLLKNASATSQE